MKKLIISFISVILMVSYPCKAQELFEEEQTGNGQLNWSGYFENQALIQYSRTTDRIELFDYNKLRLDMDYKLSANITFNADIIFQTVHGKTKFYILDYVPENIAQSVLVELSQQLMIEMEDEIFVNDAYVTFYFGGLSIRIGKQQIPWGTAYTWNPTDNLHDKNQLDPTYEKTGVNAFKLEIPLGLTGSITSLVATRDNTDEPSYAFRIKKNIAGFDISASYQNLRERITDPTTFIQQERRRQIIGFDFTGELLDLGVWGEGIYSLPKDNEIEEFYEFVLGMDYTFYGGLYIMTEYYHRDQGIRNKEDYSLAEFMKLIGGEITNIGSDYLVAGTSYPLSDLFNFQTFSIINLKDGSWILIPWLIYDAGENIEIYFALNLFFGEKGSEYGEFGKGGFARIRIYF